MLPRHHQLPTLVHSDHLKATIIWQQAIYDPSSILLIVSKFTSISSHKSENPKNKLFAKFTY